MIRTLISLILIALLVRWKWDELRALARRYVDLDWDYEIWTSATSEEPAAAKTSSKQAPPEEDMVYISSSGTRYHRAGCHMAGKDARAIPVNEAKEKYQPCGRCKPDA